MLDDYGMCWLSDDNQWEATVSITLCFRWKGASVSFFRKYILRSCGNITGDAAGLWPHYLISINVLCAKLVADMEVDGYVSKQYTAPLALLRRDVAA